MPIDFQQWYQDHRDELTSTLSRAVLDAGVAEDAVDEAFTRAFERWDRVAELRSPAGWVYTVALNAARRSFRRQATESRLAARTARPEAIESGSGLGLHDLLSGLPERQRLAVVLRHVEGLTEVEIAMRMGVTRSTVSTTLRDAHRSLADRVRRTDHPEGTPMHLQLARVRSGSPTGCDVAYLDTDVTEHVGFGAAVVDRIRVRRDDLVAVDVDARPPEIVWRWWHGVVEAVSEGSADVRRPTADGSAVKPVVVPEELRPAVRPGMSVWFGNDDGTPTAIAVAGDAGPARDRLPSVAAAYE